MGEREFAGLENYLIRIPAIDGSIGRGTAEDGTWWVEFAIDIKHPLAWQVVQELGHVLNHVSLEERLPTVFMPTSPPPYMNGGPRDFLSWVIQATLPDFTPDSTVEWLEGRLPRPVEDESGWTTE